jgi:S-DNA-T family DNA segregation ATPase FtsK/SpoIIIE
MVATQSCLETLTLAVVSGHQAGRQIPLAAGEYTVGRSMAATITLAEPSVSRIHARLRIDSGGQCFVRDLSSTNGIQLNGERLGRSERRLQEGDQLRLGRKLSLRLDSGEALEETQPSFDPISGAFDRRHLAARVDATARGGLTLRA